MTRTFEVFRPYEIDRDKVFRSAWQKERWEYVDQIEGGKLSDAIGIYVFSLRTGGTISRSTLASRPSRNFARRYLANAICA